MHKIKIYNILQGSVLIKDKHYSIGFVTNYGTATIRFSELDQFLAQNPHLQNILKGTIIDSSELIGKYINVKNKSVKCIFSDKIEYRIRVF